MGIKFLSRTVLISAVVTSLAYADKFSDNLEKLIKEKTQMEVKVIDKKPLKDISGLNIVTIHSMQNNQRFPIFANSDGTSVIGYSNLYFTQEKSSEESVQKALNDIQAYNDQSKEKDLETLFSSFGDEYYVTLKGKSDKVTIVVTDPECPYCRKELANVEEKLKETTLKLIIAPVHGKSAFIKGQLILDESKKAKNNKEKIEIFKKYFDENYKLTDKQNSIEPELVNESAKKIFASGLVRGVPFLFEMPTKK